MADINSIRKHIVSKLTALPPTLTYHNISHTLDVETQCITIAYEEGVRDEQSLLELGTAALYHDCGMLYQYKGHEEKSCEIAKVELPGFHLKEGAIKNICEIILATRVPQLPQNILQKIICDADLDYLGREDYFVINENLRIEFIEYGIIFAKEEWEDSRISFLKHHRYFTKYSQQMRNPKKMEHLNYLLTLSGKTK